ncbi:hypothetical protein HK405_014355, partial [Cladochytrium tenue]
MGSRAVPSGGETPADLPFQTAIEAYIAALPASSRGPIRLVVDELRRKGTSLRLLAESLGISTTASGQVPAASSVAVPPQPLASHHSDSSNRATIQGGLPATISQQSAHPRASTQLSLSSALTSASSRSATTVATRRPEIPGVTIIDEPAPAAQKSASMLLSPPLKSPILSADATSVIAPQASGAAHPDAIALETLQRVAAEDQYASSTKRLLKLTKRVADAQAALEAAVAELSAHRAAHERLRADVTTAKAAEVAAAKSVASVAIPGELSTHASAMESNKPVKRRATAPDDGGVAGLSNSSVATTTPADHPAPTTEASAPKRPRLSATGALTVKSTGVPPTSVSDTTNSASASSVQLPPPSSRRLVEPTHAPRPIEIPPATLHRPDLRHPIAAAVKAAVAADDDGDFEFVMSSDGPVDVSPPAPRRPPPPTHSPAARESAPQPRDIASPVRQPPLPMPSLNSALAPAPPASLPATAVTNGAATSVFEAAAAAPLKRSAAVSESSTAAGSPSLSPSPVAMDRLPSSRAAALKALVDRQRAAVAATAGAKSASAAWPAPTPEPVQLTVSPAAKATATPTAAANAVAPAASATTLPATPPRKSAPAAGTTSELLDGHAPGSARGSAGGVTKNSTRGSTTPRPTTLQEK